MTRNQKIERRLTEARNLADMGRGAEARLQYESLIRFLRKPAATRKPKKATRLDLINDRGWHDS